MLRTVPERDKGTHPCSVEYSGNGRAYCYMQGWDSCGTSMRAQRLNMQFNACFNRLCSEVVLFLAGLVQ